MPFAQVEETYPPRHWALIGEAGTGKSTFAMSLRSPVLVIDADHRVSEVQRLSAAPVLRISNSPVDNVDVDRICTLLNSNMGGAKIHTLVVDSLSSILSPLVMQAMVDKDAGRVKNLSAAFRTKAILMRLLQDTVTKWGTDVLWIWHTHYGRDGRGNEEAKETVSLTEYARLRRCLNMRLQTVQDERSGMMGISVVWARTGRWGMTLWDETGIWEGMPDKIEHAVYDGFVPSTDWVPDDPPEVFPNKKEALVWGFNMGAFNNTRHAENSYNKLREEKQPDSAEEMARHWIEDVQRRMKER